MLYTTKNKGSKKEGFTAITQKNYFRFPKEPSEKNRYFSLLKNIDSLWNHRCQ